MELFYIVLNFIIIYKFYIVLNLNKTQLIINDILMD